MQHLFSLKLNKLLRRSFVAVSCLSLGMLPILEKAAHAIVEEALILLTEPLNIPQVSQYRSGAIPADGSIITEGTISQTDLTIPSLWWAEEQFGGTLLDYWVAHTGAGDTPRRVDLLVNQQVWAQSNYLDRYAFINHFGTSASDFGYSTRIFNWQGDLLGAYICEFVTLSPAEAVANRPLNLVADGFPGTAPNCQVFLDSTGRGALTGTSQLGVPLPTTDGID